MFARLNGITKNTCCTFLLLAFSIQSAQQNSVNAHKLGVAPQKVQSMWEREREQIMPNESCKWDSLLPCFGVTHWETQQSARVKMCVWTTNKHGWYPCWELQWTPHSSPQWICSVSCLTHSIFAFEKEVSCRDRKKSSSRYFTPPSPPPPTKFSCWKPFFLVSQHLNWILFYRGEVKKNLWKIPQN